MDAQGVLWIAELEIDSWGPGWKEVGYEVIPTPAVRRGGATEHVVVLNVPRKDLELGVFFENGSCAYDGVGIEKPQPARRC